MFHLQVRDTATSDWRNVYTISDDTADLERQIAQCLNLAPKYEIRRARIVETMAGEFMRVVPLALPYAPPSEAEQRRMVAEVADRIAERYHRRVAEQVSA